jgi:hypothetical protein
MINIFIGAILLAFPTGMRSYASVAQEPSPHGTGPQADRYDSFREANNLVRLSDYPKAITHYRNLAAAGEESGSLYWNWAQVALAQGRVGEALWAYLRARELEPGDRAISREIERLRESINLDAAELTPEPLAVLAISSRRFHFDIFASLLLALSVLAHLTSRLRGGAIGVRVGVAAFMAGTLLTAWVLVGALADPTGVVVRRGAPLVDAATASAETLGELREGEVVPILQESGSYLLVEDSSGARGWAHLEDVRRLDRSLPAS